MNLLHRFAICIIVAVSTMLGLSTGPAAAATCPEGTTFIGTGGPGTDQQYVGGARLWVNGSGSRFFIAVPNPYIVLVDETSVYVETSLDYRLKGEKFTTLTLCSVNAV